jgi:diaminopimelate decarboxylase
MTERLTVRDGFPYRRGHLCCEQLGLEDLAERYGTPLYVYSESSLRSRFRRMDAALAAVPHTLCYSVKANSNLAILRLFAALGAGFDIVSGGELERVLVAARRAASKTVFSGVGKTPAEMDAALAAGILIFNVESEGELELLAERAARKRIRASIALRVNPDVPARTHPYIATGLREHKFGVSMNDARRLYRRAARMPWLEVRGISVHIGSQVTTAAPFAAAMRRVARLARELQQAAHRIQFFDGGGGLGIFYRHGADESRVLRAYAQAMVQPVRATRAHLLLEPGRWIAGPAGILLTRVLYQKRNGRKHFTVVDAAMNDLIRPALYGARHEIVPVRQTRGRTRMTDVVGPICESGDFLARGARLPALPPGSLLAVLDAGAYGMSLASNYNSRLRAAEVMVRGRHARVIRRREAIPEMLRPEL